MALIACKECGNQVAHSAVKCPKCGAPTPRTAQSQSMLAFLGVCLIGFAVWFFYSVQKRVDEGAPPDAAFCSKNLSYYENFCKGFPANCKEGPRKLARCDQGWNK